MSDKINMRIAMLANNEFVMDKRIYKEAKALSDAGYNLILFAERKAGLQNEEVIDGIVVKRIFDKRLFDIKQLKYPEEIAKTIIEFKPDVVHCHDWTMLHIGGYIKRVLPSIKIIYDSHELFSSWPIHYTTSSSFVKLKTWVVRKIEIWREKRDIANVDYLVTVSQSIADYLEKYFHLRNKPVLIRNFADTEQITERNDYMRKHFNIPSNVKVVVFFAYYIYKKKRNIEPVINQLGNKEGIAFVILCNPRAHKQYFVDMVKKEGYKNIYFHELIPHEKIVNTLASCDVGVIPTWNKKHLSYWLGLENKLFHYVMSDLPILCSAIPEHQRIIDEYKIGECADGEKEGDYYRALQQIFANYDFYKENVIKAKKELCWEKEKEKLLNLYDNLKSGMLHITIKENLKIAMLVDNPFEYDNRVYMEANTLSDKYDLTLFAFKSKRSPENETINKIKVKRIFTNEISKYSNRKELKSFAKELLKENFNIIHCHDSLMLEIGAWIKKMNKEVKLLYDSHEMYHSWPVNTAGMNFNNYVKSYIVRKLRIREEKRNAYYIDELITVNNSLAEILKKYFSLSTEPVVLRNAPYKKQLLNGGNILRNKFNIPADKKILVFIGMKLFPKLLNLERVVDEFANVEDYCIVFISSEDDYQKFFKDYVIDKGIKNVFFHPFIEIKDIEQYLSDCNVGLVPTWNKKDLSYWYALDNKLFFYVSSGIPVLATAQPEYRNVVEKYNIGVCVNPDSSPSAYLDGMKNIMSNYDEYKVNAMKAREVLNWEHESVKLLALYEKLINQ